MKDTDLAIMDAINAVEKITATLEANHKDDKLSTKYYCQLGKLAVIIWTLRSLLS